jgi:hypothetical protein
MAAESNRLAISNLPGIGSDDQVPCSDAIKQHPSSTDDLTLTIDPKTSQAVGQGFHDGWGLCCHTASKHPAASD